MRNNNEYLTMKVRIAAHENADEPNDVFIKECWISPPSGMHILEAMALLFGCKIIKLTLCQRSSTLENPTATILLDLIRRAFDKMIISGI